MLRIQKYANQIHRSDKSTVIILSPLKSHIHIRFKSITLYWPITSVRLQIRICRCVSIPEWIITLQYCCVHQCGSNTELIRLHWHPQIHTHISCVLFGGTTALCRCPITSHLNIGNSLSSLDWNIKHSHTTTITTKHNPSYILYSHVFYNGLAIGWQSTDKHGMCFIDA